MAAVTRLLVVLALGLTLCAYLSVRLADRALDASGLVTILPAVLALWCALSATAFGAVLFMAVRGRVRGDS